MLQLRRALLALPLLASASIAARAQTDFYNTDRGRPLTIEDAIVVERRAFELQAAPLTFQRIARGVSHWGIAPELAWGFLPRTHVELALPIIVQDEGQIRGPFIAVAGLELEFLHQLNTETTTLPALALGVGVHLPVGPVAPPRALTVVRALATRTFGIGRVHVNAAYTPGADLRLGQAGSDSKRWQAGVAVDHTFVLRSMLIGAELFAQAPMVANNEPEWRTAVGVRQQVSPRLAMDAGVGRRISAGDPSWTLTMGAAYAFAPPRMPGFNGGAR